MVCPQGWSLPLGGMFTPRGEHSHSLLFRRMEGPQRDNFAPGGPKFAPRAKITMGLWPISFIPFSFQADQDERGTRGPDREGGRQIRQHQSVAVSSCWKSGVRTIRPWSQSYDFWIYSYNPSVVCSRLERFSKQNRIFLFSKCARLPVAL
jgi:hypothetical protein